MRLSSSLVLSRSDPKTYLLMSSVKQENDAICHQISLPCRWVKERQITTDVDFTENSCEDYLTKKGKRKKLGLFDQAEDAEADRRNLNFQCCQR